jgi:hypothetical protein
MRYVGGPAGQTRSGQILAKVRKIAFYMRFGLKCAVVAKQLPKRTLGKSLLNLGKAHFICVLA